MARQQRPRPLPAEVAPVPRVGPGQVGQPRSTCQTGSATAPTAAAPATARRCVVSQHGASYHSSDDICRWTVATVGKRPYHRRMTAPLREPTFLILAALA